MKVTHTAADGWLSNNFVHWHPCTAAKYGCEAMVDYEYHTDGNNDGKCDVCGRGGVTFPVYDESRILGASVSVGTDLGIVFYATLAESVWDHGLTVTVDHDGEQITETVDGYYSFEYHVYVYEFTGIAPQAIGDVISAQLLDGDEVLDTLTGYSVAQNLANLLSRTPGDLGQTQAQNEAMRQLIADLVAYSTAAQTYAGYRTDAPVSGAESFTGLTPREFVAPTAQRTVTRSQDATEPYFRSVSLYMGDSLSLYVRFNTASGIQNDRLLSASVGEQFVDEFLMGTDADVISEYFEYGDLLPYVETDVPEWTPCTDYVLRLGYVDITRPEDEYTVAFYKYISLDDLCNGKEEPTPVATLTYSLGAYVNAMQNRDDADMAALARAVWNYAVSASGYAAACQ